MKFFSSSATNKVDAKGRVSIPAPFRKVLAGEEDQTLYLMPDIRGRAAVEGYGHSHAEMLAASVRKLHPLSAEHDALADVVFGRTHQLPLDSTGRIVLPPEFRELMDITDEALFVGRVSTFQIWKPETYRAMQDGLREVAIASFDKMPWGDTP